MTEKRALFPCLLLGLFMALVLAATSPGLAQAQAFENFDRDDFEESDEEFIENGDAFTESGQDDFTEGGRFVDEDTQISGPGISITGRRTQLRVRDERQLLPRNVAWGAGTGLLIGGWFALIESGSDRQTQRSIGLGIVLGAILGMTVGLKTVIAPDAPRAVMLRPAGQPRWQPTVMLGASGPSASPLRVGFTLHF